MGVQEYIESVKARDPWGHNRIEAPAGGYGSDVVAAYKSGEAVLINHDLCLFLIANLLHDLDEARKSSPIDAA